MSNLSSRALAVGVGVLAAGLVASPAFAAPAATPTSLTLKATHSTIAPKHRDELTVTLKAGKTRLAGQTVYLERRADGVKKWSTPVAVKTKTNAKGQVELFVVPGSRKGHKEQYEVLFKGNAKYHASHSSIITVTVS